MATNHGFNCEAGDILSKISASFLVSYLYCKKIDETHDAWKKYELTDKSFSSRISKINNNEEHQKAWLEHIALKCSEARLNRNTIGLTGAQVKEMAKELL